MLVSRIGRPIRDGPDTLDSMPTLVRPTIRQSTAAQRGVNHNSIRQAGKRISRTY